MSVIDILVTVIIALLGIPLVIVAWAACTFMIINGIQELKRKKRC